jgi:hypothetical protein
MSIITAAPEKTAVEAARVAFAIASSGAFHEEIVFRDEDFVDVHASVRAALEARAAFGTQYRIIDINAEYGIHGSHLDPAARIDNVGGLTAAVVYVKSQYEIDGLTQIPVLGALSREMRDLADATEAFVSLVIYIIEKPQKEDVGVWR